MTAQTLRIALIAALFVAGQHGAALANGFGMPQGGELQRRLADFAATKPRSVIEFQPFRAQQQATTAQGATITLTSLQPKFNTWFTLDLGQPGRNTPYHLELANPQANTLQLLDDGGATLVAAVRALSDAGITPDDVALHRPTLDDAFLALTGDPATHAPTPSGRTRRGGRLGRRRAGAEEAA